jgi:hypothetical protein
MHRGQIDVYQEGLKARSFRADICVTRSIGQSGLMDEAARAAMALVADGSHCS